VRVRVPSVANAVQCTTAVRGAGGAGAGAAAVIQKANPRPTQFYY